jgi:hypothetical protein
MYSLTSRNHFYVVTIFNETESLAGVLDSIKEVRQSVTILMHEMEAAAKGT